MITTMNDNRASILGTITSGSFAFLSNVASHFESHAQTYAAAAAILAAGFTIANIIKGWLNKRKD